MSEHSEPASLLARARAILEQPAAAYRTQVAAVQLMPDIVAFLGEMPESADVAFAKMDDQEKQIAELTAAIGLLRADLADANARLKQVNDVVDAAPAAPAADGPLDK